MLEISKIQKRISSEQAEDQNCPKSIVKSKSKRQRQSFSVNNCQIQISNKKSVPYPEPVSSSQGASEQLQYLSYLVKVIDSSSQFGDSQSCNSHFMTAQYWRVIYLSAIYVKKRERKTSVDDELLMEAISDHFRLGVIIPQSKDQIGHQLLDNGYFLLSYAMAVARTRKSKFVFRFLMNLFYQRHQMNYNREEFLYYFNEYIEKNQIYQVLDDENETPRDQTTPNENIQNTNRISNNLQVIKLLPTDDIDICSNYSKTIKLSESDPQQSWC